MMRMNETSQRPTGEIQPAFSSDQLASYRPYPGAMGVNNMVPTGGTFQGYPAPFLPGAISSNNLSPADLSAQNITAAYFAGISPYSNFADLFAQNNTAA
ncbi:hypothetical protein SERLA73DRAFT_190322, partial [Serpula lacrymans var. lacrymans S7.3]